MDPIMMSLISSAVYDLVKAGAVLSCEKVKDTLTQYITSERHAELIAEKISQMDINRSMSEYAIEEKIKSEPALVEMLSNLPQQDRTLTQIHYGSGDNVGGNKYGR
ncbi:hypothetical protein HFD91_21795 [Enterobacteriaceae bacterium EKM102V]|uniref:GapS6a family protein n=1 Tax=Pantoea TaxID=53335 RepID=UPI00142D6473|nr:MULTISPECIES: hypothetical protein [Pantoea]KAF6652349.1 hypothetical protein HFD91_21795 [Enterobacteriaceae bacterium EKM102V]KAF6661827.1 hypothetical protein HFD97_21785 [Pantoea sp. EKM103V]